MKRYYKDAFDEGRDLTAESVHFDFRNTIIIATSNVGARESAKSAIGFVSGGAGATKPDSFHGLLCRRVEVAHEESVDG